MKHQFELFTNPVHENETYIVCKTNPFHIGRVLAFTDDLQYAEFVSSYKGLAYAQVYPYRILVIHKSSLTGRAFASRTLGKELSSLMHEMAEHYRENIIKHSPLIYGKYAMDLKPKEDNNATI